MYFICRIVASILGTLPPGATTQLAHILTFLAFDLFRVRRAVILKNLGIALASENKSQKELTQIGRTSVFNFCLTVFELFRSFRHEIAKDIEIIGGEHLNNALNQGKGCYILCFHLGNWEAMGAKISKTFAPAPVLVKKIGQGGAEKFVSTVREYNGFLSVKRKNKGDGFLAIKQLLTRNHIVGFVIDQSRPGEPRLPFFGKPAKTNTSLAAIRKKMPAPVVPGFIHRTKLGHHILEFLPELNLVDTADQEDDIIKHSIIFNEITASIIKRFPEHYFWLHDRWK